MFTPNLITITFITTIFGFTIFQLLENRLPKAILKIMLYILILFSIYNFFAGLSMVADWVDPLSKLDLSSGQARTIGRTGRELAPLLLIGLKFWPYFLMGWGVLVSFVYFAALSSLKKK